MLRRAALYAGMAAACLLGGLTGCGLFGPAHGAPDSQADAVVDMSFHNFKPSTLTIYAGQTVEWRNVTLVSHTVTNDPALALYTQDARRPEGLAPFNSGEVKAGDIVLFRFPTPGVYRYFCVHHEKQRMVGEITVLPQP
ncbi:cupredoxin domain-containing protein [Hypericibacter sp.]|uniref:cupredoxin domain-containing protein n=1 Tax=Hypericibacter sp. TaxID=2705401 RepID=UPI003D6D8E20